LSGGKFWSISVALSGGGIRSASFNLGFLQALVQRGAMPYVDFLSTVSGGGYIGSFLSSLAHRRWRERELAKTPTKLEEPPPPAEPRGDEGRAEGRAEPAARRRLRGHGTSGRLLPAGRVRRHRHRRPVRRPARQPDRGQARPTATGFADSRRPGVGEAAAPRRRHGDCLEHARRAACGSGRNPGRSGPGPPGFWAIPPVPAPR